MGNTKELKIYLEKQNYDYTGAASKEKTDEEKAVCPDCSKIKGATLSPNNAGYVLDRIFGIAGYDSNKGAIKELINSFYKPTDIPKVGDIVVYGDFARVAVVGSVNSSGTATIEGKYDNGAIFAVEAGKENRSDIGILDHELLRSELGSSGSPKYAKDGYYVNWDGDRRYYTLTGAKPSSQLMCLTGICPCPPIVCPDDAQVESYEKAPVPDEDFILKQIPKAKFPDQRDTDAGNIYQWTNGEPIPKVDVRESNNSKSGNAGDPKIITRTYRAAFYSDIWSAPSGGFSECNQTITIECKNGKVSNGSCVDTSMDHNNSFSCGNKCAATEKCINGMCCPPIRVCSGAKECCSSGNECCSGGCTDIHSNPNNCGSCGYACLPEDRCCSGECTDTYSDPNNCGNCGIVCQSGETCCNSECIDTDWNNDNCGDCGNACSSGETCIAGECLPSGETDERNADTEDAD